MSSSLADAILMASLLKDKDGGLFETRRSSPQQDFFTQYKRMNRYYETLEETKAKKEKEKKDKDNKTESPKISYLEAVFWLFFLSPIIGPLWYNLEHALAKSMN